MTIPPHRSISCMGTQSTGSVVTHSIWRYILTITFVVYLDLCHIARHGESKNTIFMRLLNVSDMQDALPCVKNAFQGVNCVGYLIWAVTFHTGCAISSVEN